MLHLLYILAFTILSLIAVTNLIRNLLMFSVDRDRNYPSPLANRGSYPHLSSQTKLMPHPELLDTAGNPIKDPLLVMRSISVEDAREQLDALYDASPGYKGDQEEA
jgi:hypothetical protein